MQKRLLDEMFKKYPDLKEIKAGQGNKRYIFKKEDEDKVKQLISVKKSKESNKTLDKGYEAIRNYFITEMQQQYDCATTITLHNILLDRFGIKSIQLKKRILRQLSRDKIIKFNPSISAFVFPSRGDYDSS